MINQEELTICRRRGHAIKVLQENWKQCDACRMWVREVRTTEEREDTPPENEFDPLFNVQVLVGRVRLEDYRMVPEEREICKRRGHDVLSNHQGWAPCRACGTWLRETRTIEERENKPSRDQLGPESLSQ
jgi:hypothetical protein